MKRLITYMKKHAWCFIIAILAMIIGIALDMFTPRLMKRIVDDVIIGGKMNLLKGALLALAGITAGRAILGYTKEMLFDFGSTRLMVDLRRKLFDHIQSLSFTFFDGVNTGELMSRIKEDMDNIWRAASFGFMLFAEQTIYFVVASVLLFILSWKLALISLVTMPLIAFIAVRLEKRIGETYGKISDQGVKLNTTAQENIAGVRLVKAFGREKYEIQKFLEQNRENYKLNMEQAAVWAKYHPKIEFLSNVVIVLVTAAGGFLVIGNEMSVGTLVAFSNYIYMLIWPMRMIGWITNILAQAGASLKKVEKIFNEEPTIKNVDKPVKLENPKGHLVFENLCFGYNGTEVLNNINIDAKAGSTIAIMGTTGAGKSSIINLIARNYESTSGNIYIDGINIRDLDLKELRRQISVVMQDTFLFSDTVEENIKFGSKDVSNEDFMSAAKDSRVVDFVMQMPNGFDTVIGERGIGLSGGQKQRIAIARALVKDCRILILDDATSALDVHTEYEIQKALEKRKDITKIIIAHRISAVKNADEILIVEDGEVAERGTHKQLLELKGRYYETCCEQFQGAMDMEEEEVG